MTAKLLHCSPKIALFPPSIFIAVTWATVFKVFQKGSESVFLQNGVIFAARLNKPKAHSKMYYLRS